MKNFWKYNWYIVVASVIAVFFLLSAFSRGFDTYVFFHKEWKMWEQVLDYADSMKLSGYHDYGEDYYGEKDPLSCYEFKAEINGKVYLLKYWTTSKTVSVHKITNGDCVLSCFDSYHVKKMVKIINRKLEEGSFVKDENYEEFIKNEDVVK